MLTNSERATHMQKMLRRVGLYYDIHTCMAAIRFNAVPRNVTYERRILGKYLNFRASYGDFDIVTMEAARESIMAKEVMKS